MTENNKRAIRSGSWLSGSWVSDARLCRSACRFRYHPESRDLETGFRFMLKREKANGN